MRAEVEMEVWDWMEKWLTLWRVGLEKVVKVWRAGVQLEMGQVEETGMEAVMVRMGVVVVAMGVVEMVMEMRRERRRRLMVWRKKRKKKVEDRRRKRMMRVAWAMRRLEWQKVWRGPLLWLWLVVWQ